MDLRFLVAQDSCLPQERQELVFLHRLTSRRVTCQVGRLVVCSKQISVLIEDALSCRSIDHHADDVAV